VTYRFGPLECVDMSQTSLVWKDWRKAFVWNIFSAFVCFKTTTPSTLLASLLSEGRGGCGYFRRLRLVSRIVIHHPSSSSPLKLDPSPPRAKPRRRQLVASELASDPTSPERRGLPTIIGIVENKGESRLLPKKEIYP
jgi:hypothetical protein